METSTTIPYQLTKLLEKVNSKSILLTFGYIHGLNIQSSIPDSIINFCVLYAFLKINEWYKGIKDHYVISESKLKLTSSQILLFLKVNMNGNSKY